MNNNELVTEYRLGQFSPAVQDAALKFLTETLQFDPEAEEYFAAYDRCYPVSEAELEAIGEGYEVIRVMFWEVQ